MVACFSFFGTFATELDEHTRIQMEALNRLKGLDLEANPSLKSAVLKVVEKTRGTPHFVELVREFGLEGQEEELLKYALANPRESSGVEAFRMAVAKAPDAELSELLQSTNAPVVVGLLGSAGGKDFEAILRGIIIDLEQTPELRKEAVRALARSQAGAKHLLDLAERGELPKDVRLAATSELSLVSWPEIKSRAAEVLPLPQSGNAEPLPPVTELARRSGNLERGREIFFSATAACSSCHRVNGQGQDFGPNLSEIGTKLGKEALYESILDPSSGISFGYEAWSIEKKDGDELYGLVTSETAHEIAIKTQGGIVSTVRKSDIARRQQMRTSIMPAGLQLTMTANELVDLVEYLASLKKSGKN